MKNMKNNTLVLALALTLCAAGNACTDEGEPMDPSLNPGESTVLNLTPMASLNKAKGKVNSHAAEWEHSSLMLDARSEVCVPEGILGGNPAYYPRLKQMADGRYILFFQLGAQAADTKYTTSDDLVNWQPAQFLHQRFPITNALGSADERRYTTTDAIVLPNGDILTATSYRANKGYARTPTDNGISLRRSTDNGRTWSEETLIYRGTNWEPSFTMRSSGRIEIYFSQSRPEIASSHSGTAMLWSDDNGHTWKPDFGEAAYTVLRHKWFDPNNGALRWTDQMPCVIELNESGNLFAITESMAHPGESQQFNIALGYAGSEGFAHITGAEEEGPADRDINVWTGAAPWVVQAPSGEVILYYGNKGGKGRIGSPDARTFGEEFSYLVSYKGSWGANYLETPHSVLAAHPRGSSKGEIGIARYFLNHAIAATGRTPVMDGDNVDWADSDDAIFAGSKCRAQATLRCSADKDNIYFLVEVRDENISGDDYVNILLSPETPTGKITSEARRIKVAPYGLKSTDLYAGGWQEHAMTVDVRTAYDGTIADNNDTDNGYLAEVAVPRSELKIENGRLLVNLVLFDAEGGEDAVALTTVKSLQQWIPVIGL